MQLGLLMLHTLKQYNLMKPVYRINYNYDYSLNAVADRKSDIISVRYQRNALQLPSYSTFIVGSDVYCQLFNRGQIKYSTQASNLK